MLPAFVKVQEIYKTVRKFITESWTSGYYRGDCGFENLSKDQLSKGFPIFFFTSSDKGTKNTLTQATITFFRVCFSSGCTQRLYLPILQPTDAVQGASG
jgi:hypothetical protein